MSKKRGSGTILACVLIVVLSMLISVFVSFVSAVNIVKQTKRNARVVLDSYVMQNSIEIYDAIKNGSTDLEELDNGRYIGALADFCTFEVTHFYLYSINSEGREQYRLSKPTLSFTTDNKLMLKAEFQVIIPMDFAGARILSATVPVTVTSELKAKY